MSPITPPPSAIKRRRPLDAGLEQPVAEILEMGKVLGRFAGRQDHAAGVDAGALQGGEQRFQIMRRDVGVGDDDAPPVRAKDRREQAARRPQDAAADDDVVGASAEIDAKVILGGHASGDGLASPRLRSGQGLPVKVGFARRRDPAAPHRPLQGARTIRSTVTAFSSFVVSTTISALA